METNARQRSGFSVDHAATPSVLAQQAIAIFDSGSGGLVTYLARIANELDLDASFVFFGAAPPQATFRALGFHQITLQETLTG